MSHSRALCFFPFSGVATTQPQVFTVPSEAVGSIIGHFGSTIAEIRRQSGATIKVQPASEATGTERSITVTGTPQAIQVAVNMISNVAAKAMERRAVQATKQQ